MIKGHLQVLDVRLTAFNPSLLLHQIASQCIIYGRLRVKVVLILISPLALPFQRQSRRLQHIILIFDLLLGILKLFLLS